MYIWVAININEQLKDLAVKAEAVAKELDISLTPFTLPLHVSLRISFPISDECAADIQKDIRSFYHGIPPFSVAIEKIENVGKVVWVKMEQSKTLTELHSALCTMLTEKYGVQQHPFDLNYLFHATLFMDDREDKNAEGYERIKDFVLPQTVIANRFLIGTSESGKPGTYSVVDEIAVSSGEHTMS